MGGIKFIVLQRGARFLAISTEQMKILVFVCMLFHLSVQEYPTEHCSRGPLNCTIVLCRIYEPENVTCFFAPYDASKNIYYLGGGAWGDNQSVTKQIANYGCIGADCCLKRITSHVQLSLQFIGGNPSRGVNYTIHMAHYEKCFPGQESIAQSLLPTRATDCLDLSLYCSASTQAPQTTSATTQHMTTAISKETTTKPSTPLPVFVQYLHQLHQEALKLNPASVEDLEKVEVLLQNVSRQITVENKIEENESNAHLCIELLKHSNHSEYNSNLQLGSTHIGFTLRTNGVRRLLVAVFVVRINTTEIAQTQPVQSGFLAITRYIAALNTTYIVIAGWDADSFLSSRSKRSPSDHVNDQLAGNVTFIGPPTSPEFFCKEIIAKKKLESNLVINKLEPICLFFDRVEMKYSNRGCVTITDDETGNVTCKCNHLTLFTVLLTVQSTTIPKGVKITSYTTESASIMFLVASVIILFKSKHSGDRVPVQISLSLALLLFHAVNISHDLDVLNEVTCVMVTVFNHYLLLCSGMWFLVEGIRLFMATSFPVQFQTQDSPKRLKIFMLIGWILPALIVGLSMAVGFPLGFFMKPQPLYKQCNKFIPILKYDRCWLAPGTLVFYTTVVAPLALVLLINFMIMLKTTHVMLHSKRMQNRGEDPGTGDALRAAKSFICLFFMLGGTWVLAFFTGVGNEISNEVFMYIHSLVNGLQGIVVFLLYCVMGDDIRQEILPCETKSPASETG